MELQQIRYFLAVARRLNFRQAAEDCGVAQPSLTRGIKNLEEELGGPLLRREGRRSHLTELGKMMLPRLEQAFALTEIAKSEAADFSTMVNQSLHLGCMCTIAPRSIMSLIEFFSREAPMLTLKLSEASGRALRDRLLDGELDVAILALPRYDDQFDVTPLFTEDYVITFPKHHRFRELDEVRVDDLRGERYLRRLNCEYMDMFTETGAVYHYETDHRLQSEHETWVQAMVIAGLGCAIMPRSLAAHPELHSRPLIDPAVQRTISMVTIRGRRHTPIVDFFVKLCRRIRWG